MTSLCSFIGTNTTLLLILFAIAWSASNRRICLGADHIRVRGLARVVRSVDLGARGEDLQLANEIVLRGGQK